MYKKRRGFFKHYLNNHQKQLFYKPQKKKSRNGGKIHSHALDW
jgi:hypothetical protein